MKKNTVKILSIVLAVVVLTMCVTNVVFAEITPIGLTANTSATGTTEVQNIGQNVMGILNVVGVVVAVVILMIVGIKYMIGSAEEKAKYKETLMPYIVGALLIFGATTFANMAYKFGNGLKDAQASTPTAQDSPNTR